MVILFAYTFLGHHNNYTLHINFIASNQVQLSWTKYSVFVTTITVQDYILLYSKFFQKVWKWKEKNKVGEEYVPAMVRSSQDGLEKLLFGRDWSDVDNKSTLHFSAFTFFSSTISIFISLTEQDPTNIKFPPKLSKK